MTYLPYVYLRPPPRRKSRRFDIRSPCVFQAARGRGRAGQVGLYGTNRSILLSHRLGSRFQGESLGCRRVPADYPDGRRVDIPDDLHARDRRRTPNRRRRQNYRAGR